MSDDPRVIGPTDTAEQIRLKTMNYIRSHRKSYIGGNLRFGVLWNVGSLLVIVLGALTSILAALHVDSIQLWLIILPALSALISTMLLQFRVRDMWKLRDEGRIETELLLCKAHLIPLDDRQKALEAGIALRVAVIEVEREQSRRFFSVLGPNATAEATATSHPAHKAREAPASGSHPGSHSEG